MKYVNDSFEFWLTGQGCAITYWQIRTTFFPGPYLSQGTQEYLGVAGDPRI